MAVNPLNHYSFTTPASQYDEEALTALELAGRTAAKVNECVDAFNNHETKTDAHLKQQDEHLKHQDAEIAEARDYLHKNLPGTVGSLLVDMRESGQLNDIITSQTFKDISGGFAYITDRPYDTDISEELQELLNTYGKVKVIGNYWISEIELTSGMVLEIDGHLTAGGRFGLWFHGSNIRVTGVNIDATISGTGDNFPVIMGSDVNNVGDKPVVYCTINDLTIENGATGIRIANNEQSEPLAITYFNRVQNLKIMNCDVGIDLIGYANANYVDGITFYNVGSETNGAIEFNSIGEKAPIENIFSNIFHTNSTDATTIFFKCDAIYNSLMNICSEPGGEKGFYCRVAAGSEPRNNTLQGSPNTRGGDYELSFRSRNTLIKGDYICTGDLRVNNIDFTEIRRYSERTFTVDKILQDLTMPADLLKVEGLNTHNACLIEFRYYVQNSVGAESLMRGGVCRGVLYNIGNGMQLKSETGHEGLFLSGNVISYYPDISLPGHGCYLYGVITITRKNVHGLTFTQL